MDEPKKRARTLLVWLTLVAGLDLFGWALDATEFLLDQVETFLGG